MKKLCVIILIAFTLLVYTFSVVYAERRKPTEQESIMFDPALTRYLKDHFARKSVQGDVTSFQKITKVEFCCVEEFAGEIRYIIDLWFEARLYDKFRLDYDGYMIQRAYFTMETPNKIKKDVRGFEMVDSSDAIRTNDMIVREGWRNVIEK